MKCWRRPTGKRTNSSFSAARAGFGWSGVLYWGLGVAGVLMLGLGAFWYRRGR